MRFAWPLLAVCGLLVGCAISCTGTAPKTPHSTISSASSQPSMSVPASPAERSSSAVSKTLPALTLHLAGDSTVSNYPPTTTQEGWGQEIGQFFSDKVTVNNQAIGGASIRSFQTGRWNNIMQALKPGDYVMIQFGANDSGTVAGRHVEPSDFEAALTEMADQITAKGATPIFVTPSAFYQWTREGKQDNSRLAPYAQAMHNVGTAKNVSVVDLNARGAEFLNSIGQTAATPLYFPSRGTVDKAHFLKAGSTKMAELVVEELRRIKSPLAAYLKS
jgi:lysophospholipase L1-like esterase